MHFTNLKDLTGNYKNSQNDYILSNKFNISGLIPDLGEKGKVSVIASRPGMGNTTLMLQTALNYAIVQNKPCYIFSLEMNQENILRRIFKVIPDSDTLIHLPINICDDVSFFEDINDIIEDEIEEGIVFIDYLDVIKVKNHTADNIITELKNIFTQFGEIAKKKKISIVISSLLSKSEYEKLTKNEFFDLPYNKSADRFIFLNREPFVLADYTENPNADNVYITIYEKADVTTKMLKWNSEKYCFEQ